MAEKTTDEGGDYYADNAAVPSGSASTRRGHMYFGFGCDMRRAVIIVNIMTIIMAFIAMIVFFSASAYLNSSLDDEYLKSYTQSNFGIFAAIVIFNTLLATTFAALGIYGALHFNVYLVLAAACWHALSALLSFVYSEFSGGFITLCFLYPHVMLTQELRNGIMTEENYPNEQRSCCYNV